MEQMSLDLLNITVMPKQEQVYEIGEIVYLLTRRARPYLIESFSEITGRYGLRKANIGGYEKYNSFANTIEKNMFLSQEECYESWQKLIKEYEHLKPEDLEVKQGSIFQCKNNIYIFAVLNDKYIYYTFGAYAFMEEIADPVAEYNKMVKDFKENNYREYVARGIWSGRSGQTEYKELDKELISESIDYMFKEDDLYREWDNFMSGYRGILIEMKLAKGEQNDRKRMDIVYC